MGNVTAVGKSVDRVVGLVEKRGGGASGALLRDEERR